MSDLMKQFLEDACPAPSDIELADLATMAEQQLFLESRVKELENLLKETQEQLRLVQEVNIPEAMSVIGMKKFTLANGYSVTIKEDVYASMRKDFVNQAIEWLDDHGLGDIVKNKVEVDFNRGEADRADKLIYYCTSQGYNASQKQSIHPMTLKATVKEQLANGIQFPEEFFSIAPVNKAVIKK